MKALFYFLLIFSLGTITAQDTLSVLSYNILNYPASNASKADTLKPIIKYTQPDIFMITELTSGSGVSTILNNALNVDGVISYQAANYVNGTDTDNMLFYNSDKLVLHNQGRIITALRDINEYVLYYKTPGLNVASDTIFIYCYMAHLKAGETGLNPQKRAQESVSLKLHMDSHSSVIENVILGGDFNIYNDQELAYDIILNQGTVLLFDPIATPGVWHNNSSFANIHTQSTRSSSLPDGGSFGGMDDRFDFIFVTNDILNGSKGLTYVPNSYKAIGNDGNHYNKSINATPTNNAAPSNIIDALFYMSDHLPVELKLAIPLNVGIDETHVANNWNGFYTNEHFNFKSNNTEEKLTVFIYNLLGKTIQTKTYQNQQQFNLKINNLNRGIYFVKIVSPTTQKVFKVFVK